MKAENYTDVATRLQEGDMSALNHLFRLHFSPLCYFAERMVLQKDQAEDIVQETFYKLWLKQKDFASTQHIKAFLYLTTRNACLNHLRNQQRQQIKESQLLYISEAITPDNDYELFNAEIMQAIYAQVEQLPPQCRDVCKLIFFNGLKTSEVAEQLGISTQTVLNQKTRGINLLRTALLKKQLFSAALLVMCWLHEN
ncbi:MAG: RNA polymerase sigma-70 factor [Chitinophagaceae bacterium]